MFIDENELARRVNRDDNLMRKFVRKGSNYKGRTIETIISDSPGPGRQSGDVNIPPIIQEIIATVAHHDKNINVADSFGVSPQQVSNLKRGLVSPSRGEDDPRNLALREKIESNLGIVRDKALERLVETLTAITPEKIALTTKVRDLGNLAASLSMVVERSIPAYLRKNESGFSPDNSSKVTLNIYAPQVQTEDNYESVVVK